MLGARPESMVETIKGRTLKNWGHQTRKQALAKTTIEGWVEGSKEEEEEQDGNGKMPWNNVADRAWKDLEEQRG